MGCNHISVDDDFFDISTGWDFIHYVEQNLFNDSTKSSGPCLLFERSLSGSIQGIIGENQLDAIKLQKFLILFDDRVLWFRQDADQSVLIEALQRDFHGQTSHELWYQAIFQQVVRDELRQ